MRGLKITSQYFRNPALIGKLKLPPAQQIMEMDNAQDLAVLVHHREHHDGLLLHEREGLGGQGFRAHRLRMAGHDLLGRSVQNLAEFHQGPAQVAVCNDANEDVSPFHHQDGPQIFGPHLLKDQGKGRFGPAQGQAVPGKHDLPDGQG